ncbi:MAG: hypothetical protein KAT43_02265 [Nanoarchaeota archaeon]|nr:hypothetical protein [Nanoarchaeota archaeon]
MRDVVGNHIITKEGGLKSQIDISFWIEPNYPLKYSNLTIIFDPGKFRTQLPAENVLFTIVDIFEDTIPHSIYEQPDSCDYIDDRGYSHLMNCTKYRITISPQDKNILQQYELKIKYDLPKFVSTHGDYYLAKITMPNLKAENVRNTLTLPSAEAIPRFIPEADDAFRLPYKDEFGQNRFRWSYLFKGTDDIIIWYWDEKQIKTRAFINNFFFTIMGTFIGFLLCECSRNKKRKIYIPQFFKPPNQEIFKNL